MKRILISLLAGTMLFSAVSCGKDNDDSNKNGYSSPEKAFEAYADAMTNWDAEKMLTLIPEDYIERAKEVKDFDFEEELNKKMLTALQYNYPNAANNSGITLKQIEHKDYEYVKFASDLMEYNEEKLGKEIEYTDFCLTYFDAKDEHRLSDRIELYKQNGRWYCADSLYYIICVDLY
ncbi:MAG: hypothetical protein IJ010_06220 [Ruminococcus sp.]|nr:hypothetical protein [Ruminococcus sp.]